MLFFCMFHGKCLLSEYDIMIEKTLGMLVGRSADFYRHPG